MEKLNITMIMVMSIDGVVSRAIGESVSVWSSKEDKEHLETIVKDYDAVVMGSKSFTRIRFSDTKYIVLTNDKNKWGDISSNPNFIGGPAPEIHSYLQNHGFKRIALLGGPITNALFLQAGMVDEILLTVEPYIFGEGRKLSEGVALKNGFTLAAVEQLNDSGTILLRYISKRESEAPALTLKQV